MAAANSLKPWVIVESAGYEDEQIASDHRSFAEACKHLDRQYDPVEIETLPVQIMRRLDDGTLTTEY